MSSRRYPEPNRRLDEKPPNEKSRGMRALRATCEAFGIDVGEVHSLRRERARDFHSAWTEEMKRLARLEGAWPKEWDDPKYRPAPAKFHRKPLIFEDENGEIEPGIAGAA